MNKSVILSALITFLVFLFAFQNMDAVSAKAIMWATEVPLALLIGVAFILGLSSVLLVSIPKSLARNEALKDANGKVVLLENMLQEQMLKNKELQVGTTQQAEATIPETPTTEEAETMPNP